MEAIWPGSGSAVSGNTPFGLYDNDSTFQSDGPKFATWAARRLGYPIMAIELQDSQFYTCFEEAITEYSSQVNLYYLSPFQLKKLFPYERLTLLLLILTLSQLRYPRLYHQLLILRYKCLWPVSRVW